jgi:hypothetical protein
MNWHERIEAARSHGVFTSADAKRAECFVTCACGDQDQRIPRDGKGTPVDPSLRNLGYRFYHYVLRDDIDKAEICLGDIEARAAEILKGL